MTPIRSNEFELAAACARWPPSESRNAAIRVAAAGVLDWRRFLRVARRHRVIGLVHDGLAQARPDLPTAIAREISAEAAELVMHNLAMAAEALRLQRLLKHAGITVLFLKGTSLAILAFGNVGLSGGQDIDLLVQQDDVSAATTVLQSAGYHRFDPPLGVSEAQLRRLIPMRKDFGFVNQFTRVPIELHWRLFLNPHAMVDRSVIAAPQFVPLTGANGLYTLGEEDLFTYLCMHGALHWWNRLKWLAEVNALIATLPEKTIERLVSAAAARGAGRAAVQAMLLCRRVLKTPVPEHLLVRPGKSATMQWLETTALKAMTGGHGEDDPHHMRFGTTRGSLSTFLLNRSWRYRFAELKIHLINPTDVLSVPLPDRLSFLYPLLRPQFWISRHVAKRRTRK